MTQITLPGLGYAFNDASLLRIALTHRSFGDVHNERQEFLGDAVLGMVVAELLFRAFGSLPEGDLSRMRAHLVRKDTLAAVATDIGLGEHLLLGDGERRSGGRRRKSILADSLEAVIGAVYLDGGWQAAHGVISRLFVKRLQDLPAPEELKDPKTRLQEWLQAQGRPLPVYKLVAERGADHAKTFEVGCEVEGLDGAVLGEGRSLRKAEFMAAKNAMGHLTSDTNPKANV